MSNTTQHTADPIRSSAQYSGSIYIVSLNVTASHLRNTAKLNHPLMLLENTRYLVNTPRGSNLHRIFWDLTFKTNLQES